ncbi:MAG: S-methyl-5-thioribose-1-phosphate isomerase [Tissierellia bacterium]|nr:S-methyl-5-thioribose-1-phosphate isomerase [Tissierellia bacterium]
MTRFDEGLAFMLQAENVAWYEKGEVRILDRRIYPIRIDFVSCKTHLEVRDAIRNMVTQSAGPYTACSMGMALAAYESRDKSREEREAYLKEAGQVLAHARPTTVPRMQQIVEGCLAYAHSLEDWSQLDEDLARYTLASMENRYNKIDQVASYLLPLFSEGDRVLTQCFGETIVGMMCRRAKEEGKALEFVCPETRPFLQGARFTASVIHEMGFPVTVITDNMVAEKMAKGDIDVFTSAADSINLDGSVINKVGTLQIAILAKHFGLPYFVTGIPDIYTKDSSQVEIEMRNPFESISFLGQGHTLEGVQGYYPAFDITPANLVSGVVTDLGCFSPYDLDQYAKKMSDGFYHFAV